MAHPRLILKRAVALCLGLTLSACASRPLPDQESGITASTTQMEPDIFKITLAGSSDVSAATLRSYALQRSAHTALIAGYDFFQVIEQREELVEYRDYFTANSLFSISRKIKDSEPRRIQTIKTGRGSVPEEASNIFDARVVTNRLPPKNIQM